MPHICTSECECKIDLDAAVARLEEASRILSALIFSSSDNLIETQYAQVKVAWIRLNGALAAYRDHLAEA